MQARLPACSAQRSLRAPGRETHQQLDGNDLSVLFWDPGDLLLQHALNDGQQLRSCKGGRARRQVRPLAHDGRQQDGGQQQPEWLGLTSGQLLGRLSERE